MPDIGEKFRYWMRDREIYSSLIRIHILHYAAENMIDGFRLRSLLQDKGYHLTPGAVYSHLKALEKLDYLASGDKSAANNVRKMYRTTAEGNLVLAEARIRVGQLLGEIIEK